MKPLMNITVAIEVRGKPDPLWDVRGMLLALVGLLVVGDGGGG